MEQLVQGLIDRASAGDSIARQRLLDIHREHLRRMIAARLDGRVAPRVDPSDVVQDTLLEAARKLDGYLTDRPLPFLPWLRQIAGERVIDAHRRHVQSQRRSVLREQGPPEIEDGSSEILAGWLVDKQPSPSQQVRRRERVERVKAVLEALPDRDREILMMRHLEHLKIEQIAEVLGINPGAVKARILRALLKMRDRLGAEPW